MARRVPLRWTEPAVNDLKDTRAFLYERSPEAAPRFASSVRVAAGRLRDHPRIGARLLDAPIPGEIRSVVVENHRLIYRVEHASLCILRVWDTRRNPDTLWPHVARNDEGA